MFNQNTNQPYEATTVRTGGLQATFFGKVMSFFALGIFACVVGVFVTFNYFLGYLIQTPALIWIIFAVELVIIFTSRSWSTKIPLNRFMFFAFTFLTGVTIAPLLAVVAAFPEGVSIITKALFASACMFTATAMVGWTTKKDLSNLRGFLFMGLIGLIVVGIIGIFIPWSSTAEMVYSGIGVLIFTGFIAYDFQKIKYYPEDRYVDAALAIYLDIFNLFLFILRFIMASRN